MKKYGMLLLTLVYCRVAQTSVQTAIEALGGTNMPPVVNGMVFVGGEYIPSPYVVSRFGNEMRINERKVEVLFSWPPPEFKPPPIVINPPKVPESITKNSTCYDVDVKWYIAQWLCYLRSVQSTNRVEEMITAFRSLPCVKKAYKMDDTAVAVVWNGDDESMPPLGHHVYPERLLRRALPKEFYTPENLIKVGNRSVERMYERLKRGDYYFLPTAADRHSRHTGLSAKAQFTVALPLIDAGATAEEISKAVETKTGAPFTVDFCRALLRHKESLTPEFRRRIFETEK